MLIRKYEYPTAASMAIQPTLPERYMQAPSLKQSPTQNSATTGIMMMEVPFTLMTAAAWNLPPANSCLIHAQD